MNEITLEAAENSAAAVLKQETRMAHCEAESSGFMATLLNPELTLDTYISVLQQLYSVLAPIEQRLADSPYLVKFPSAEPRILLKKLEQDLVHFGALEKAVQLAQQRATSRNTPESLTLGETAGVLYVIEGAAYGGKVLCRLVANRLAVTQESGLGYFSQQAQTGVSHLLQLKHELDGQLRGPELETAIRFAKETFRSFAE